MQEVFQHLLRGMEGTKGLKNLWHCLTEKEKEEHRGNPREGSQLLIRRERISISKMGLRELFEHFINLLRCVKSLMFNEAVQSQTFENEGLVLRVLESIFIFKHGF